MSQTLKICPSVPFGMTISTILFRKADILGFMKNLPGHCQSGSLIWHNATLHGNQVSHQFAIALDDIKCQISATGEDFCRTT